MNTAEQLKNLTTCIFAEADIVEVRMLPAGKSLWFEAKELHEEADRLTRENSKQNIYLGANPRTRIGGTTAEEVELARCLFVDWDDITIVSDDQLETEVRTRVEKADLPQPTVIIKSGHGAHAYWRLNEPINDLEEWSALQKRLIQVVKSDGKIHDPPRIMRAPGFTNLKPPVAESYILFCDPYTIYSLVEIEESLPVDYFPAPEGYKPPKVQSEKIEVGERNNRMASIAGKLRNDGLSFNGIFGELIAKNKELEDPLPRHELRTIAKSISRYKPGNAPIEEVDDDTHFKCTDLNTVKKSEVDWLWVNKIPRGKLTLLTGDGGVGKSFFTCYLAAAMSRGFPWPQDNRRREPARTLLVGQEDDLDDTVVPRVEACQGNMSLITSLQYKVKYDKDGKEIPMMISISDDIGKFEKLIKERDIELIVFDPIMEYVGDINTNDNNEVRGALMRLLHLARQYNIAVICVTHFNKKSDQKAMDRVMGSKAFTTTVRVSLQITFDPDDDEKDQAKRRRLLAVNKGNICTSMTTLAYRIVDGAICFENGTVNKTADEAMGGNTGAPMKDKHKLLADWFLAAIERGPVDNDVVLDKISEFDVNEKYGPKLLKKVAEQNGIVKSWGGAWRKQSEESPI